MSLPRNRNEPPDRDDSTREELRKIRAELTALRKLVDTFCGVFLNSRFPFGRPNDRWGRR